MACVLPGTAGAVSRQRRVEVDRDCRKKKDGLIASRITRR